MNSQELTQTDVTFSHVDTYLQSLRRTFQSAAELADEWAEMEEIEQFHFRLEFTRAFGLRRLFGAVYRVGRFTPDQIARLADLDRYLLAQAASVEVVSSTTLGYLVHDLFAWGTPLAEQSGTLQIETTLTALAELAHIEAG